MEVCHNSICVPGRRHWNPGSAELGVLLFIETVKPLFIEFVRLTVCHLPFQRWEGASFGSKFSPLAGAGRPDLLPVLH